MAHGGDLTAAEKRYGRPSGGWLDLSTGINGHAYPVGTVACDAWRSLPQQAALDHLLEAARTAYAVPDHLKIVAVPGTQAAIQLLPRTLAGSPAVAILGPTYSEHAAVWRASAAAVVETADIAACLAAPVAVVVNPNNPDGCVRAPGGLLSAWRRNSAGRLLVIDEAFVDCLPEASALPGIGSECVVVLRSFGKFFGLAGLRLGFAVAPAHLAARLKRLVGPWPVSGPALEIGTRALADTGWIAAQRRALADDARRFDAVLDSVGLAPRGAVPLFRLVEDERAAALHRHLAGRGIWTRIFADRPGRIRFGLPRNEPDRERVRAALESFR